MRFIARSKPKRKATILHAMTGCVNTYYQRRACPHLPRSSPGPRPQMSVSRTSVIVRARPGEAGCLTLREAKQPRRREANGAAGRDSTPRRTVFFFRMHPCQLPMLCFPGSMARRGHVHRRIHAPSPRCPPRPPRPCPKL
jgi:hypothetical protein